MITKAATDLHAWLQVNGRSQSWLARQLGISSQAVCQWLGPPYRRPKYEHAGAIERLTGVRVVDWISPALEPSGEIPSLDDAREVASTSYEPNRAASRGGPLLDVDSPIVHQR